jgi:hypothetical protein
LSYIDSKVNELYFRVLHPVARNIVLLFIVNELLYISELLVLGYTLFGFFKL